MNVVEKIEVVGMCFLFGVIKINILIVEFVCIIFIEIVLDLK